MGKLHASVGFELTVRSAGLGANPAILEAGYSTDPEEAQRVAADLLRENPGAVAVVQAVAREPRADTRQPQWDNATSVIGACIGGEVSWTADDGEKSRLTVVERLLRSRLSRDSS